MSVTSDGPFFGGVVPKWVRLWCPTYYLGIIASLVYLIPFVAIFALCALVVAFGQGFIAICRGFDHD